jgi:hypothetical protein
LLTLNAHTLLLEVNSIFQRENINENWPYCKLSFENKKRVVLAVRRRH